MAERDPTVPQSDDPELHAAAVRLLRIVGPLGRFNVLDTIVPVLFMGDVVERSVEARPPVFTSSNLFTEGVKTAGVANELMADTGQLAMGSYDIVCTMANIAGQITWEIQHRNAANTANVAAFQMALQSGASNYSERFAYTLNAADERFRIITLGGFGPGQDAAAHIFAAIRT